MLQLVLLRQVAAIIHTNAFGREGVKHSFPHVKNLLDPTSEDAVDQSLHTSSHDTDQLMEVRPTCEQARDYCIATLGPKCGGIRKTTDGMWSVQRVANANRRLISDGMGGGRGVEGNWGTMDIAPTAQIQFITDRSLSDESLQEVVPKSGKRRNGQKAVMRHGKLHKDLVQISGDSEPIRTMLPLLECHENHSKVLALLRGCGQAVKLFFKQYAGVLLLLLLFADLARRQRMGTSVATSALLIAVVALALTVSSLRMDGKPWWEQRWMEGPKF
jgi:hypothetical protein